MPGAGSNQHLAPDTFPPMYEHIDITEDSGIATITLNRPEKLNAFVGHMRRDLAEALEAMGSDRAIRVVVLTGAGRAFAQVATCVHGRAD